jgi:hypothetical protein
MRHAPRDCNAARPGAKAKESFAEEKTMAKKKDARLGKQDRWPSDYGKRDAQEGNTKTRPQAKNRSWTPGDKGQGREGLSKGYGGSGDDGTGPSGPESKSPKR